jgi:hypothetical protein
VPAHEPPPPTGLFPPRELPLVLLAQYEADISLGLKAQPSMTLLELVIRVDLARLPRRRVGRRRVEEVEGGGENEVEADGK